MVRDIRFCINTDYILYLIFLLLLIPARWVGGIIIAAVVHEASHIIAVLSFGGTIRAIEISAAGARISTSSMKKYQSLLCSAAGPAGGALLILGYRLYPEMALCAAAQSIYNLLPVSYLDGGKVLYLILNFFFGNTAADVMICISDLVCTALFIILSVCLFPFGAIFSVLFIIIAIRVLMQYKSFLLPYLTKFIQVINL